MLCKLNEAFGKFFLAVSEDIKRARTSHEDIFNAAAAAAAATPHVEFHPLTPLASPTHTPHAPTKEVVEHLERVSRTLQMEEPPGCSVLMLGASKQRTQQTE